MARGLDATRLGAARPARWLGPVRPRLALPARALSRAPYVHPLSEAALSELRALSPPWFDERSVQLDPKDGTFSLTFTLPPPPPQDDDARPLTGTVQTLYEPATRNHYLSVREIIIQRFLLRDECCAGGSRAHCCVLRIGASARGMILNIALRGRATRLHVARARGSPVPPLRARARLLLPPAPPGSLRRAGRARELDGRLEERVAGETVVCR